MPPAANTTQRLHTAAMSSKSVETRRIEAQREKGKGPGGQWAAAAEIDAKAVAEESARPDDGDAYEVGYGPPPRGSRFKPGRLDLNRRGETAHATNKLGAPALAMMARDRR